MTDRKVDDQAQGMMITLNVNREELKDVDMDTVLFTVSEEERLLRSPEPVRRSEKRRRTPPSREIKREVTGIRGMHPSHDEVTTGRTDDLVVEGAAQRLEGLEHPPDPQ